MQRNRKQSFISYHRARRTRHDERVKRSMEVVAARVLAVHPRALSPATLRRQQYANDSGKVNEREQPSATTFRVSESIAHHARCVWCEYGVPCRPLPISARAKGAARR
jgi:hypothetical protein